MIKYSFAIGIILILVYSCFPVKKQTFEMKDLEEEKVVYDYENIGKDDNSRIIMRSDTNVVIF